MSFADKFASLMDRPGQNAKDDVPWWMRYGGRGLGTVGGFIAIFLGVWNCVGIITGDVTCVLGGIWQIVAGFVVICCEAPCCCLFVDHVQRLSEAVEKRPYWNKAVGYVAIAIPAIIICTSLASIFGSGLIFCTGVIYGMMALGKKATIEEMRSSAAAAESKQPPPQQLQQQQQQQQTNRSNSSMQANLVANAQPISFTGTPLYDSNV